MIIGTAGHIDHGKTSLVRALTGVDTDRLKEEKARGISIELGYAYLACDAGVLGFVDVPGHERLVHTMTAGACGIDFALLVIAADDGIMPQTREHVAILELLGVRRAAVALTKIDRVDRPRVSAVIAQIESFLANTALRGAPVFALNALSAGDPGVSSLLEHLRRSASQWQRAPDCGLFRLAIDRVFTLVGHGTVVAGTVFSGKLHAGETVTLFPSNVPVRVRSIHAHNRPADFASAGERCALNLVGIAHSAIRRGDWLADARLLLPTTRIDVQVELLSTRERVLRSWTPVHFHHGAGRRSAHLVPLEGSALAAGQKAHAQLVFDSAVCVQSGDRFILRDAQAAHTIGGGRVLDPCASAQRRRSPQRARYRRALERMLAGEGLAPVLQEAPLGIRVCELIRLCGRPAESLPLPEHSLTITARQERYVLLESAWQSLRERALGALSRFHREMPEEPGPEAGRLRRIAFPQLPDDLWRALLAELASERQLCRRGPWVYLPEHVVTLSASEAALARELQPLIAAGGFDPPWVRELARSVDEREECVRRVLRKQVAAGNVYQIVQDLFYDRRCIDELAGMIMRLAHEHGPIAAAQFRDAVGLGRKRAIQILEFFDRAGLTRRVRDLRIVRADSGWGTA